VTVPVLSTRSPDGHPGDRPSGVTVDPPRDGSGRDGSCRDGTGQGTNAPSNLTPLPSKGSTQDVARLDYGAYLDSMLAHLRRVHRGQVLRYYGIDA
jgi:hypothetical protein